MTVSGVNGSGNGARSGTRALALLATPLHGTILRRVSEGPKRLVELRSECGSPAQTTLRAHLRELEAGKAIEKRRGNAFPGVLECELTTAGRELLFVADAVERWLGGAPVGPLPFGSGEAKTAIRALIEGWSSTMLRALAARPLSLTELDGVITALSYPSLERRLAAMKLIGQVEPCPSNGRGTPYAVTEWLRHGVAPLAAAARWERRHVPEDSSPISRLDVEAAFLLALPLLEADVDLSGACRLAAEFPKEKRHSLAGVMAEIERGRVVSCDTRLDGDPDAWIFGSSAAWLNAVIEDDGGRLELGGDQRLARALLDGLHEALFGGHPAIHP